MKLQRAIFNLAGFNGTAPDEIVYVPAGTHEVFGTIEGKPGKATITPSEALAGVLNQNLQDAVNQSLAGEMSRPFIDFEHSAGRAAALPVEFYWDAERGIILKLEWTPAGRSAVEGKEFSYFSPEVALDPKTKQIIGLVQPGPIGGLVNLPAFQKIPRIAAKLSTQPTMPELLKLLIEQGLLPADATEVTAEAVGGLRQKLASASSEIECAKAKASAAEAETVTVKAKLAKINDDAAENFVTEQFKAGRFDEAAKPLWLEKARQDLDGTKKLLGSFKAAPASSTVPVTLQASGAQGQLPKIMSKAQFDSLSIIERRDFSVNGGRISD